MPAPKLRRFGVRAFRGLGSSSSDILVLPLTSPYNNIILRPSNYPTTYPFTFLATRKKYDYCFLT